jgi:hypothetical protein
MNEFGIPVLQKGEPLYKYYVRLDKFEQAEIFKKKTKILKFINDWYSMKKGNDYIFKNLWEFKNQYYKYMPNDKISKEFLIKNFNEYDEFFNLDLEYNEDLFTTYNVLYFIKLMLKTLKGDLKKEIEEKEDAKGYVRVFKKYSIRIK